MFLMLISSLLASGAGADEDVFVLVSVSFSFVFNLDVCGMLSIMLK